MRRVHYGETYNGMQLSCSVKNNNGFYTEILEAIQSAFEYMLDKHSKVFFTSFVIKFPTGSEYANLWDNSLFSRFIEALILDCKRKGYGQIYLWTREWSTTGQVHYHLILLFNGNKIQNAYGVLEKATKLWQGCLGVTNGKGLVHLCEQGDSENGYGGVNIRRHEARFQENYHKCFELASYLAKRYSKDNVSIYTNQFSRSRLPKQMGDVNPSQNQGYLAF